MDIGHVPPGTGPAAQPALGNRSIGAVLIDTGKLSASAAETVLRSARESGLRFGEAAVKLGYVTADDVEHALAQQFDYPYLAADDDAVGREVVAAFSPFSAPVEALRALRTQLMLRWFSAEHGPKALAIVSADRGDGRSHLAANLAVVFSQLGERTLLVDADLRNPRQHRIFKLDDRVGLSALLAGRGGESQPQRIRGLMGLSVLPAGATPPNPQELLGRAAFPLLLEELSARFDVILVDTAAAGIGADFQSVAAVTRGAILLGRRNVTRTVDALAVRARIDAAGAKLVGAVLNDH
jgi:receptor protein-tyrosine kinase